jgi:hypothetical protein
MDIDIKKLIDMTQNQKIAELIFTFKCELPEGRRLLWNFGAKYP